MTRYADYTATLLGHQGVATIERHAEVTEAGIAYPLWRITTPGRRRLLITAGFHGNEIAGPLTLVQHLPELVAHARARDVGLTIYPCINPSGFAAHTRYNASDESPNNDFLRYELRNGVWVDVLEPGQPFVRHALFRGGPKETIALRTDLERQPRPDAALDLHQDPYLSQALTYAYSFGDRAPFRPLLTASAVHVQVALSSIVDDGVRTDELGLIALHDGSITDWLHRAGVPYTAALETTTATPLPASHQVNLIWLRGFIDLASAR